VVNLQDMPAALAGHIHPLSGHFNLLAANRTFSLSLAADYETVYQRRRVAETRRANTRKDHRLAELGTVRCFTPENKEEVLRYVDELIHLKAAQLAARGIHGVFGEMELNMMRDLSQSKVDGRDLMTTRVLTLDGETLAATFGGIVNGTYWFYVSSLAPHAAARKYSPGDHALRKTIEACCGQSLAHFDFGAGEADYKLGWADHATPLHVMLRARTWRGLAWAGARALRIRTKRLIKQTPILMRIAMHVRQTLHRRAAEI
jgi:CelD/BcsL family acetyltransferase involved in cellulose biosynthesis